MTDLKADDGSIGRTTAQIFALVVGTILLLCGIAALVINFDFHGGSSIHTEGMLFMDVNGWSGVLMLVTGLTLLIGTRSPLAARRSCVVIGGVYLLVTIWSLFTATVAGVLPVSDLTAIFYAAIAVLAATAGLGPDPRDADA